MSVPRPGLFVLLAIIWVCDGSGHKIFLSVMKTEHLEETSLWDEQNRDYLEVLWSFC